MIGNGVLAALLIAGVACFYAFRKPTTMGIGL